MEDSDIYLTLTTGTVADDSSGSASAVHGNEEERVRFKKCAPNVTGTSACYYFDAKGRYFLKQFRSTGDTVKLKNEQNILQRIEDFFRKEENAKKRRHFPRMVYRDNYCLVTEHCGSPLVKGEDVSYLGTKKITDFDDQVREILEDLRQMRILHRDISKHELLVDKNGCLMLVDFGNAVPCDSMEHYDRFCKKDYDCLHTIASAYKHALSQRISVEQRERGVSRHLPLSINSDRPAVKQRCFSLVNSRAPMSGVRAVLKLRGGVR